MGAEVLANPYPGLRPFEFPERHLFFGREGQSEELSRRLRLGRFLAVVGASGSGKSSLVRAGLLPALYGGFMDQVGPRWRVALLRPGNEPIRNLAAALVRPADFGGRQEAPPKNLLEEALVESNLRVSSLGLLEYLRKANLPHDENLLIVVDQFEELFRFKKESRRADADDEAAAFVKLLLEATRSEGSRVYVVITMRSDFLGDCAQFRGLPEAINKGQYLIPRMTREQQRPAIVAPAKVYGAELTTRLVNRLLNDIGDNQDQLPILQHALMRTWDEWKEKRLVVEVKDGETTTRRPHSEVHEGVAIDSCCYAAVGGMAEALSRHADEAYEELAEGAPREIAERLFKSLTETDRDNREIRRRVTVREVCAITKARPEEVIPVVNTFRNAGRTFIMPPPDVTLDQDSLLDISHESLIRNWKRLDSWVKEEARSAQQYRRLAEAAELHEAGELGYWRDPQLSFALQWRNKEQPTQEWASRYHPAFSKAMDFLTESKAEQEKEREREEQRQQAELEREREYAKGLARSRRRLRYLVAALAVMLIFAVFATVYAFQQKRQAEANEQRANDARAELSTTNNILTAEKAKLEDAKTQLSKQITEKEKLNVQLKKNEDDLKTSLTEQKKATARAEEARKRAAASEAQTAAALKKQKELTATAKAAEEAAIKAQRGLKLSSTGRSGLVLVEKGEFNQARTLFSELLKDYTNEKELTQEERIDGRWWASHNLGAIYGKLEDYDLAAQKYNEAIQTLGDAKGERRRNLIATLRRLGQLYAESGNHRYGPEAISVTGNRLAEGTYSELLSLLDDEDTIKKEDPRYEAHVKKEYADVLYTLKQDDPTRELDAPKKLYQEALSIYETYKRERNTPEMIGILNRLAEIAMQQNPAGAEAYISKALQLREREAGLDPTEPEIAESYADLARVYQETGPPEKATNYGNLADQIRAWTFRVNKQKSFPPDKLKQMVDSYVRIGRCDSAEKVYLETLNVIEESHNHGDIGENNAEWFEALLATARFYRRTLRDDQSAAQYFAQYVDKSGGVKSGTRDFYLGLAEAGQFFGAKGDYARAEIALNHAYARYKMRLRATRTGGGSPMETAILLRSLGQVLEAAGKEAGAEALYREALELVPTGESRDPNYAVVATLGLANLYLRQGKDVGAEEHFKKAVALIDAAAKARPGEAIFLLNLPEYVRALMGLGAIEERKSPGAAGSRAAVQYFEQALSAMEVASSAPDKNLFNPYFVSGKATMRFDSDRADVLEALAKHLDGERAAGLRKQAEETRQRIKAAKDQEKQEMEQRACSGTGDQ